jgi:hypothetical protein
VADADALVRHGNVGIDGQHRAVRRRDEARPQRRRIERHDQLRSVPARNHSCRAGSMPPAWAICVQATASGADGAGGTAPSCRNP